MSIYKELTLDPFQREALAALKAGSSVIVAAPTGCGKTVVAAYAIERALEQGERVVYTSPIKALSNQKFRDFGVEWGDRVGIMTGDVTINPGADALIMTTEIFRNTIFESPEQLSDIGYVILDEVHYLDDPERGTVWEESIMFAPPSIRFVYLSATISNLDQLAGWLRKVRPGRLKVVVEKTRPVPLSTEVFNGTATFDPATYRGARFPLPAGRGGHRGRRHNMSQRRRNVALVKKIVHRKHLPCLFFVFSRVYTERLAMSCLELRGHVSARERAALRAEWRRLSREFDLDEAEPETARLRKLLTSGIAYHHAGMLPTRKEIVERFFTSGLIKVLFATETFSLGVNMPARSVAFELLRKFDGVRVDYMPTRGFLQMAGRAGRRGMDEHGYVYANVDSREDAPRDVRRVLFGGVEEVVSQFALSHATILRLYSHLGDGIYEACEKSFAYFRHRKKKGAYYLEMVSLIRRRIRLLAEQGYLVGRELTEKGRFCSQIFGYETQLTELFVDGLIEELEPPALAVLLTAVLLEPKREGRGFSALPNEVLRPLKHRAEEALRSFQQTECDLKLPPSQGLCWDLGGVAREWALGADLERVMKLTELAAGDVVRNLRMVLQLLRQLRKAVRVLSRPQDELERLDRLFHTTAACIKRDEVDAERQLRRSVELDAEG
ncbi:DEAD/DEAH box helicase [Planctomycetota bacterium]